MFYRFEFRFPQDEQWHGISRLNPSERRRIGRILAEPKYYQTKPEGAVDQAWFTEHGFRKMMPLLYDIVDEKADWQYFMVRIITANEIASWHTRGKTQVIAAEKVSDIHVLCECSSMEANRLLQCV